MIPTFEDLIDRVVYFPGELSIDRDPEKIREVLVTAEVDRLIEQTHILTNEKTELSEALGVGGYLAKYMNEKEESARLSRICDELSDEVDIAQDHLGQALVLLQKHLDRDGYCTAPVLPCETCVFLSEHEVIE